MLKFKKGGYTRHDSGTVYKVKDIFPNKYNPQVLLVSLVTRKRTYTRVIQTDKAENLLFFIERRERAFLPDLRGQGILPAMR